jgi:AcrR family transcriptional regulator
MQPGGQEAAMPDHGAPRLRADARRNQDRLLEVAATTFRRDGGNASLRAIARDAGVGIGTLYRRFPTREALVEAVYRNESARLCAGAAELLTSMPPVEALRTWMNEFVDYILTKNGMAEALHVVLTGDEDLRTGTRALLAEAVSTLIAAGAADRSIRADVDAGDVLMALGGIVLITAHEHQRPLADRLLDLLMAGLLPRT